MMPERSRKKTFADRLKELRKERGISQAELAGMIEVHFTQVSRYERGETKPSAEAMTKMARALNTTVDYLMNGSTSELLESARLDKELIDRFKQVQELGAEEKKTVLSLLDGFYRQKPDSGLAGGALSDLLSWKCQNHSFSP